jgi:hypothetical protein
LKRENDEPVGKSSQLKETLPAALFEKLNGSLSIDADHLPLFRQSAILLRETGIDLSRATLDGLPNR